MVHIGRDVYNKYKYCKTASKYIAIFLTVIHSHIYMLPRNLTSNKCQQITNIDWDNTVPHCSELLVPTASEKQEWNLPIVKRWLFNSMQCRAHARTIFLMNNTDFAYFLAYFFLSELIPENHLPTEYGMDFISVSNN